MEPIKQKVIKQKNWVSIDISTLTTQLMTFSNHLIQITVWCVFRKCFKSRHNKCSCWKCWKSDWFTQDNQIKSTNKLNIMCISLLSICLFYYSLLELCFLHFIDFSNCIYIEYFHISNPKDKENSDGCTWLPMVQRSGVSAGLGHGNFCAFPVDFPSVDSSTGVVLLLILSLVLYRRNCPSHCLQQLVDFIGDFGPDGTWSEHFMFLAQVIIFMMHKHHKHIHTVSFLVYREGLFSTTAGAEMDLVIKGSESDSWGQCYLGNDNDSCLPAFSPGYWLLLALFLWHEPSPCLVPSTFPCLWWSLVHTSRRYAFQTQVLSILSTLRLSKSGDGDKKENYKVAFDSHLPCSRNSI